MERRRTFSREFKLEAAKNLDVHENVLRKWVRELRDEPLEAFPGNGKRRPRTRR